MNTKYNSKTEEISKAFQWLSKYWDKPVHPEYHSVTILDDAVSLLDKYGDEAEILAGGTDLISLMKKRIRSPGVLVNIKPVEKIRHITSNPSGITIGAMSLIRDLERSPLVRRQYPILLEAARSIASPHLRNMGSVAGNLCQETRCWYYRRPWDTGISFNCRRKTEKGMCYAIKGENQYHGIFDHSYCVGVCPSDLATVMSALEANVRTIDSGGGRSIPIDEFYTSLGNTLKHGEIITNVEIPEVPFESKQRFLKFRLRETIDFAIASVAVVIKMDGSTINDAKIVLGGVSPKPYHAVKAEQVLIGEKLTEELAKEAAKASTADARPLHKNSYKLPIVEALVKRAVMA